MFSQALYLLNPTLNIIAYDKDKEKIEQSISCNRNTVIFHHAPIQDINRTDADLIIFNDVLHHNLENEQEAILKQARKLLKKMGYFY